jgi:hypothetical protein
MQQAVVAVGPIPLLKSVGAPAGLRADVNSWLTLTVYLFLTRAGLGRINGGWCAP